MFESIVLRRSIDGPAITAGELAEALLFYQNVHIVLDYSSLISLDSSIGIYNLFNLINRPGVTATYIEDMPGTQTTQSPQGPQYSLVAFMLSGDKDTGPVKSRKKRLEQIFLKRGYDKGKARNIVERFRHSIKIKNLTGDHFVKGGLISAARCDLTDDKYVNAAARSEVKRLLSNNVLPADFFFRVNTVGEKFSVSTNIDFNEISANQQAKDPNAGKYTPAHITSAILDASIGTIYASHYGGDYYTSNSESQIIQIKQHHLLKRTQINKDQIEGFKSVAINDSPSVADVINNGERSFDEFLELLSSTDKFKKWLRGKSPDENLVSAYLDDVTSSTWLNKIPGKSIRYVVSEIAGVVEPITGTVLSVTDSFFLDKIFGGWRPNQFVSKELSKFLNTNEEE